MPSAEDYTKHSWSLTPKTTPGAGLKQRPSLATPHANASPICFLLAPCFLCGKCTFPPLEREQHTLPHCIVTGVIRKNALKQAKIKNALVNIVV